MQHPKAVELAETVRDYSKFITEATTLIVEVARSAADTHVHPQASAAAADSTAVVQAEVLTAAAAVVGKHIERYISNDAHLSHIFIVVKMGIRAEP